MLDLFGWEIEVTWLGIFLVAVGAVVIGGIAQIIGEVETGYEWLYTSAGAFVGGIVASEWLGSFSAWGTTWEGVRIFPALVGALVLGAIVDWAVRASTGGSYVHHPHPA